MGCYWNCSGLTPEELTAEASEAQRVQNAAEALAAEVARGEEPDASAVAAPRFEAPHEPKRPPPMAGFGANRAPHHASKEAEALTQRIFAHAARGSRVQAGQVELSVSRVETRAGAGSQPDASARSRQREVNHFWRLMLQVIPEDKEHFASSDETGQEDG